MPTLISMRPLYKLGDTALARQNLVNYKNTVRVLREVAATFAFWRIRRSDVES